MSVHVKIVNGVVSELHADHPYEALYTAYCLGVLPPVLQKGEAKGRLERWEAWLSMEDAGEWDDDSDDDDDGGEPVKPGGDAA